ncbi:MAG: hypothetical protein ACOVP4_00260 [Bacteriovoracaceae bacterium]|jgi:hypothetical protein
MKLWFFSLIILFGLMTSKVWASSRTECQLTEGIYQNSQANLGDFYFFSYADIFTINNAKSFIMQIDGQELHLQRDFMDDHSRGTQLTYLVKTAHGYRKIFVMLDRSPKNIVKTKMFQGNFILSPEMESSKIALSDLLQKRSGKTFNFSCRF